MKFFTAVVAAMLSVAVAFTPAAVRPNTRVNTICMAKHVQHKAAKNKEVNRPRKHRPSDINRKPVTYELTELLKNAPPEYVVDN
eukprot:CAMPEP_0182572030 /NCGR_PEP_ID=MMETSP1324-20130603/15750_1 /TAXON_ID=236786 /ORGANISM="Florenciella sp., Strain RCC1587" /LENGTH=83 /DNA_ID=CAMNT_0024786811 /DNA_START=52 /DNA_END=303 /DNA_ORIENTATION=-